MDNLSETVQKAQDWHPADIKAALEKSGWTLSQLAQVHGYFRTYLTSALRRSFPAGEQVIAAALGLHPSVIWPSRYRAEMYPTKGNGQARTRRKLREREARNG